VRIEISVAPKWSNTLLRSSTMAMTIPMGPIHPVMVIELVVFRNSVVPV
jgi:hypothetical protein